MIFLTYEHLITIFNGFVGKITIVNGFIKQLTGWPYLVIEYDLFQMFCARKQEERLQAERAERLKKDEDWTMNPAPWRHVFGVAP